MKNSKKNVIAEYEIEYNGQKVKVHKFKAKDRKALNYARPSLGACPNCLSRIGVNASGVQYCTGNKLKFWENEFIKFNTMDDKAKVEYLSNITEESQFLELYDRFNTQLAAEVKEDFNCGYINKIFFPVPSGNVTIPDPVKVSNLEKKLKRRLTEEELFGESELWECSGAIGKEYKKGAKRIRIALIKFPQDA